MNVRKSTIVWSTVLIILSCNIDVDAAKASRRGGTKVKTPNYNHVALSYGGSHGHQNTQHQQQQHHHQPVHHQPAQQHQTHQQFAPSAPVMPNSANNNNKPVGWNVPAHNTPEQAKTATNTHSALPYPQQNPPPYTPNTGFNAHPAGPPPPYSANPAYNSHVPAGPPPPYSQNPNTGFHSNVPTGQQPPAYQPSGGAYPVHNQAGANYPQQPYNGPPAGGYPQQSYAPQGQQAPVINNFYGQPQAGVPQATGGGGGGGFLQTLAGAAAGSLAGNAIYGALKPDSEHKTVIIHENAPAPAAAAPVAPIAQVVPVAPVAGGETTVAPIPGVGQPAVQPVPPQPEVRIGDTVPLAPVSNVPLAPLPEQANPQQSGIPLAPMTETTTIVPNSNATTLETTSSITPNQTFGLSTTVPLAPFSDPASQNAQAQKASASTFAIFNISVYTIVSIIVATVF